MTPLIPVLIFAALVLALDLAALRFGADSRDRRDTAHDASHDGASGDRLR